MCLEKKYLILTFLADTCNLDCLAERGTDADLELEIETSGRWTSTSPDGKVSGGRRLGPLKRLAREWVLVSVALACMFDVFGGSEAASGSSNRDEATRTARPTGAARVGRPTRVFAKIYIYAVPSEATRE
jgi:hypothetical protein